MQKITRRKVIVLGAAFCALFVSGNSLIRTEVYAPTNTLADMGQTSTESPVNPILPIEPEPAPPTEDEPDTSLGEEGSPEPDIPSEPAEDIPPEAHTHTLEYRAEIPATCDDDGTAAYYECMECGETYADEYCTQELVCKVIPALGHSLGEYIVIVEPGCFKTGIKARVCERCGQAFDEEELAPTEHDWEYGRALIQASCTENGKVVRECKNCGIVEIEETEMLAHDWDDDFTVDTAATCTTSGIKSKHCKNCDARTEMTEIEKKGHNYSEWEITKQPNCTETGEKHRVCEKCDAEQTEIIGANGHEFAAEWMIDENEHWRECACGEITDRAEHAMNGNECEVCGYTEELEFVENADGTYTVVGRGNVRGSELVIPREYNGKAVTGIGESAFKNDKTIARVYIPSTVKCIGKDAFKGCSALDEAEFEQLEGWYTATRATATNGTNVDVKRANDNARKLTVTSAGFYWLNKK